MTKKNARKRDARARLAKFGGKYLHHYRAGSGPGNRKLTMETVVSLARQRAKAETADAPTLFGDRPFVYVVGDASEPLAAAIAATYMRVTIDVIRAEVERRHVRNDNLPFGGVLTVGDLGEILRVTSAPEQFHKVVEFVARFSTPPPTGYVHVFAIAEGSVMATLAAIADVCVCGHLLAEHDADGACTWIGVPDGRPILGVPQAMLVRAQALGVPLQCPCRGVIHLDASGRRRPN